MITRALTGMLAAAGTAVLSVGLAAPAMAAPAAGSPVEANALSVARSEEGKPYQYGAAGPNSFDCSGLVQYSFARAGRQLPRTAAEQYSATTHLPQDAKQPGDLLFFYGSDGVYHVAFYAGGDEMIDAPHSGTTVEEQQIWSDQYYVGRVS